jgi:hypothetical protein
MENPLFIGLVVFAVILAGAFAGWTARQCLPAHHVTDETKNLVSMSMAVGCDDFGAGAWAVDFERKQLVHCARRGGDGAVGGNPAT